MLSQYLKQFYTKYFLLISIAVFTVIFFLPSSTHAAYRDTIQADTPLYYWPMDEAGGATSLTAAVGGTAINLTGATAGASGQVDGTAVSFNGTTNSGQTASSIDLTAYNKIVVEGLFYFDVFNNTDDMAFETGTWYNTTGSFHFNPNSSSPSGSMLPFLWGTAMNSASYSRPSAVAWHHVAVVWDMSASTNEVNLYIDGTLQTPSSRPANNNNTGYFGNLVFYLMNRNGSSLFTQGKVQHLAIYSNLSSDRILAHYNEAFGASFSTGTLSEVSHDSSSAIISWTDASGGTAPITAQLQRSPSGTGTWSNISGATASPVTNTGLSASTAYDYRVAYTDATPTTIYSNTVTVTTDAESTTTYTVQQTNLWDNGYDNVSAPRQSTFTRFVFTTDAANITVTGTTDIYSNYSQYAHLGILVDGVAQSPLAFTANGSHGFDVTLGTAGTTRTVQIITGLQSTAGGATSKGSFIDSITYPDSASFTVQTPTVGDRILFYGDSILVGGNATNPEYQAYATLLRTTYGFRTAVEGWGYRALYDDANTSGLRSAFVSRLAGYTPPVVWFQIGTNDYGLSKWSAASFGTAYAATLDDLHTALPSAQIVCQTPIIRGSEGTLPDYRTQIASVCNARSPWATLVDGTTILTTSDLADGVHPSTAGHAKYALAINNLLDIAPTTSATATAGGSGYTFNNWTASSTVSVSLSCNANGGIGCFVTKYCTDTTNSCNPSSGSTYSGAIPISTEGTSYVIYFSQDNLGTLESVNSSTIKIDTTNPTINAGDDQNKSASFTQVATASDDGSDINASTYQWVKVSGPGAITFGSATALSTTISADTDGTYVISFTATDNVGNSASDNFTLVWNTAPTTYTITSSAGSHGSISPSGATVVNSGDNQSFNITADSGYHISDVVVDSSSVGAVSSYTFSNVTTTHIISATFAVTSSGGSGSPAIWTLPIIPLTGFKLTINSGALTTSNRNVFLGFNAGTDIKKMSISMTGDFTDASQENYTASKQWDLCSKFGGAIKNATCPDGIYKVYAQFYTAYGRTTGNAFASSTITLKSGSTTKENLQQYTNLPFTNPFTKYLQYRQTNTDIKRLQIFLNADPDTKIADTGAGSPGKETNYFGILTYKAVIKFQEKYAKDVLVPWGFKKGTGYVGKTTLAKINELMGNK